MSIRTIFISLALLLAFHDVSFAGDTVSESKKIDVFTVLKIEGDFTVVLTQGSACSLKIDGDKDAVAAVQVLGKGVTLSITKSGGAKGNVTLYITFKDINQVSVSGNCTVSATNQIKTGDLMLSLNGNTQGSLNVKTKVLTFNSNTDKNFTLTGKANRGNAKLDGEGAIDMSQCKIEDFNLEFSSDADAKIYAHPKLNVKMSGAGNLIYYGNPRIKVFKVDGTGMPKEAK